MPNCQVQGKLFQIQLLISSQSVQHLTDHQRESQKLQMEIIIPYSHC